MNVLDLFSGIGGFSLGLERAGMRTVAFCEIDPFCRKVLAKHWPGVPIFLDIRTIRAKHIRQYAGKSVDVICGGFPCQDVSLAGKRRGIEGDRSGLWNEFARIIREIRPKFAIVENTPGLLSDGFGRVLGDLAEIGYDAEWDCISASSIGAPHVRDRVWIVAYPRGGRKWLERSWLVREIERSKKRHLHFWKEEPVPRRVADGLPDKSHRLAAIGNAVIPQIPEIIGRAIMTAFASHGGKTP